VTPAARFLAAVDAIRREIDHLPESVVRAILADLDAARRQVLGEIAGAEPGTFAAHRLAALEQRLADVMARFVEKYDAAVVPVEGAIFDAGAALVATPLQHAGLTLGTPVLSRRLLEAAQTYRASLITGATDEAVHAISQALRLGALRGESVPEIAAGVAGHLTGPGPFGTLAARAEAITRTELGRVQAIATQAALVDAQQRLPDLQKEWRHSANVGRWARLGHIEAGGQVVDVGASFHIRPAPGLAYEDLEYPRDPRASAKNTVRCGCLALPYRAAWAGALDAARTAAAQQAARRARDTRYREAA
jgi:hypothetical protein